MGINFMVSRHYDAIDAEYSLTEGGNATIDGGRVVTMNIGAAEKVPARARLVARGTSGHGSVPRMDSALIHLGAAVESPAGTREDLAGFGAHSDVERLAEPSICLFVEFVWNAVAEIAASRQ